MVKTINGSIPLTTYLMIIFCRISSDMNIEVHVLRIGKYVFTNANIFTAFAGNCKYELFLSLSPSVLYFLSLKFPCTMCPCLVYYLRCNKDEDICMNMQYIWKVFYWHCSSIVHATEIIICTKLCKNSIQ